MKTDPSLPDADLRPVRPPFGGRKSKFLAAMNSRKNLCAVGVAAALGMSASETFALPVTIDFDAFAPTTAFGGGVEDGILIGSISGPVAVDSAYLGPFSAPNSLHHNIPGAASFSLTRVDTGDFTFTSFRSGSAFGGADPLTVTGFLDGAPVGTDVFSPNPAGTYFLLTPTNLSGVTIDALTFNMGPAGPGPTHLDDIVLNLVPEPSSALLLLGSGGMLLLRRRRAAAR